MHSTALLRYTPQKAVASQQHISILLYSLPERILKIRGQLAESFPDGTGKEAAANPKNCSQESDNTLQKFSLDKLFPQLPPSPKLDRKIKYRINTAYLKYLPFLRHVRGKSPLNLYFPSFSNDPL